MVKIYTEYEHARVNFVFGFFFGSIRKDWTYVSDVGKANIAYTSEPPKARVLWIPYKSNLWSNMEDSLEELYENAFKVVNRQIDMSALDLGAFVFHALSRMEEYSTEKRDEHDRFLYGNSLLYKYDLLKRPIVDELMSLYLKEFYIPSEGEYNTLDVDTSFYYLGKGKVKNWGLNIRDLLSFRFKNISKRWKVRTGRQIDPYQYNIQSFIAQKPESHKEIFWLMSSRSENDRQVSLLYRKHQKFIIETNNKIPLSLHASYEAYTDANKIKEEKEFLEKIIEKPVTKNRFHYLRLKFPESYRSLQLANIKEDWTMGYPDTNGFRAGTTRPFYWYDLERENQTSLLVVPFQYIDLVSETNIKPFEGRITKVYHNFEPTNL